MIIQFVKFQTKLGKEKTVHKIIRESLAVLYAQGHKGMSYHSFRNQIDKLQFVQLNIFGSTEAKERFDNSKELCDYYLRLKEVIDGDMEINLLESFELYHAK